MDIQTINEQLLAKLVIYEEQQRKLQADLEQVTKRANSQTSESGSVDELHNQLEWNEMSPESDVAQENISEGKSVLALRMVQIEEEREAMDSGQQELEEELSAARGLGKVRPSRRKGSKEVQREQEDFDFPRKDFEDQNMTLDSVDSGENMGGLRSVVEELELERNQLQEQIMSLEERCQELEDRLQLQIRIESLQSENERFQSQIVQLRQQQTRENEKHLNLTSTLNEQLKGLTDRTAFLENSIAEKDQILLESKGKLEKQAALKKVLQEKEDQLKMLSEKLGQSEEQHEETMKEQTATKAECAALKVSNNELTEKVAVLKDRLLKQDSSLEKTQLDLEQTNEELDRLNTSHLEERSQLIHDLQRCEREMDILKDVLKEKDKELSSVSSSLSEYAEQVIILKEQINFKDDQMREMTNALAKVEREFHLLREAQTSDVQETSSRISALSDQLREMEVEFNNAKYLSEAKAKEAKDLYRQIDENGITIKNLHSEIQAQSVTHNNHIIECSSQITSLKEQITAKVTETEAKYQIEIESLRSRELKLAKEQYNILVSDLTKKHEEVQQLMNELAEQKQCCDHLKKELQEKASSFQQKLESDIGLREEKLRGLQGNVEEYQKQLNEKLENIKALEADKNGLCDQIKSLQAAVAERDQKLKAQLHTMEENRKNILALEQQKQQMDSEKDELMKELTNRESEVGSLNQTLQDLQRKMEETELWLAEERKNVSHLMGDKEELQSKISQVSEQSLKRDTEISKQLEDKSMECLSLTKQLCVEQQASIHSQNHLQVLESQLKESEKCAQQNAVEMELRKGEYNILCERFRLSEETSVLLKKQVEELTTANERERQVLHEKDQVINTQHAEIGQWKASFAHLQNEEQNLREELRRLSQQAAELNSAVENEKLDRGKMQKELDCKIEENASLRSSLESVNTVVDGLNREKEEAATFVTSLESQRDHFQAHGLQIQTETDSLKKQLIDLKSENEKLNCDIKLLNSNLADKVEEINVLSSHLSQQGHTILSLKDQLDTVIVESKTLLKTIEEKEVVISQKEELIQLTEKRLEGENRYLQKISALQNELQSSGSELEQQRQKMKDQELDLRNLAKELKLYKDKSEEAQLLKVQLSEHVEVISDLHSQNKDLRERVDQLSGSLTQKEEALKEKFDIFLNLQALYADAQEALDVQKKQVEHLMSKNVQYETLTSEKDCAIKKWEVDYGELNVKLADKETMCETLTQQVAELQKINGNENQKLTELNLLIKERENSLLAKESKIQELTSRLKDSEMSIKEKETAVQNLQEKYASLHDGKCELEQSVVIKEEEISRLLNSLQEKEEHLHQTENKVLSFSNEVGLLREELDRCSSNLKNVSLSIQEKDETILLKQQSVQSIEAQLQSQKEEFQKALSQLHALKQEVDQKNLAIKHLKEERNSQCQLVQNLNLDVDRLNSEHLKSLNKHILQKEELESKVHSTNQEKMLLDAALKALEVEKENRVALLQKQLFEKADLAKKLQDKLDVHVKEAEVQLSANTLQLKNENADLQKQVSGQTEEIGALKLNITMLEHNVTEQHQQSIAENERLTKLNSHLENELQTRDITIQTFLKDMGFVEEQLSALCDINSLDRSSFDNRSDYKSQLERLSSMFSVALQHRSDVAELKQTLEEKQEEIGQKSDLVQLLERSLAELHENLQKVTDGSALEKEYLMKEVAAFKVTDCQQRSLLGVKEKELSDFSAQLIALQEETHSLKVEKEQCYLTLDEDKCKINELLEEAKNKDIMIQTLNVQLIQEKDLIAALGEQIHDKDNCLKQETESMSNQRAKHAAEREKFTEELHNLQSTNDSCTIELKKTSERLEVCKIELQQSQTLLAEKEMALSSLMNEKDLMQVQLEKFSKEKEKLKRKLQAALVVRKDLMQKMETDKHTKQDEIHKEQMKIADFKHLNEELNSKLDCANTENEDLKSQIEKVTHELMEKDRTVSEVLKTLSEKETNVEELNEQAVVLQHSLVEKEETCREYLRSIQEMEGYIIQIQKSMSEKIKSAEEENSHLHRYIETLKAEKPQEKNIHPTKAQELTEIHESSSSDSSQRVEASQQQNRVVHNNVHASLLCSEEIGDSQCQDDHARLLIDFNHVAQELEHTRMEHAKLLRENETVCKENEESKKEVETLQKQFHFQQEQLNNQVVLVETQRLQIEKVLRELSNKEQNENTIAQLMLTVHEKDSLLSNLNVENEKLLNETLILKAERQRLLAEHKGQLEKMNNMERALNRLEQYKIDNETMAAELSSLHQELVTSRKEFESSKLAFEQVNHEKDEYFEAQQIKQLEIEQLKLELASVSQALVEKNQEFARVQDSLKATSESDIEALQRTIHETQEESRKVQDSYDQKKGEMRMYIEELNKANGEKLKLQTRLKNYSKEEERLSQRCREESTGKNVHDDKLATQNLETCNGCSTKEKAIEDLKREVYQNSKMMEELIAKQDSRTTEERDLKEQIQRKLQAALISRKEILKENKVLKQNIETLKAEIDGFRENHENRSSEILEFSQEKEDILNENKELLSVNENLSAACESLKSTMETIVQEKEAFSFQLNSLKDSQTVELSGWKARHGELNKEYESLLQAYENISDEIDKMRQVIEFTKKEKNDLLQRFQDIQIEKNNLEKQIDENNEDMGKLAMELDFKEQEVKDLQKEIDRLAGLAKSSTKILCRLEELVTENDQIAEEKRSLEETCENLKISIENIEEEKRNLLICKNSLENLQMDMYKSDTAVKMSQLVMENEMLSKRVENLNNELMKSKQSLVEPLEERCERLERHTKTEPLLKEEKVPILKMESDINHLRLENLSLSEKVKILEDDKALLQEEIESVQEQYCKVKNEKENLETDLISAARNNQHFTETFKSLQVQTNLLSQQVENLRSEKCNIMREKEENQLQVLRDLEQRVKCAQDDSRGNKSKSKELQELLKEKQQEVSQLQRDSIRFQELILDLEESVKESNCKNQGLQNKLNKTLTELDNVRKELSSLNQELSNKIDLLESREEQVAKLTKELKQATSKLVQNGEQLDKGDKGENLLGTANVKDISCSYKEGSEDYIKHKNDFSVSGGSNINTKSKISEIQTLEQLSDSTNETENALKILEKELARKEDDLHKSVLEQEKLKASLEKQMAISQHMKQIISNKDSEIATLMSSKDGELSSYLEQIQIQFRRQLEGYEQQLSSLQEKKESSNEQNFRIERDLKNLQAKYDKAISHNTQIASEIEALKKSMCSLQSDRDLLCSELKDINSRHEFVIVEKDGIIDNVVSENNSLKEEVRKLLYQTDDLNAENAMLGAQLIRYREDLNQVLSLKDHQLKEMLRQKMDNIKSLELERRDTQKQNRDLLNANTSLKQTVSQLNLDKQKLSDKVKDQESLIAAINKEKIVSESNKKKDSEFGMGEGKESNLPTMESNSNLKQNSRSEEKTYCEIHNENNKLTNQNESLRKAMAALQNNRDSLIEDFKALQWKYMSELKDEKIRGDDLERQLCNIKSLLYNLFKKYSLLDDTSVVTEDSITLDYLASKMDFLCTNLASKGVEVSRLSSECASYTQQIDAFSKAMASLQHDRERLIQELRVGSVVGESKQGNASSGETTHSVESKSINMSLPQPQSDKQVCFTFFSDEHTKLRTKIAELERLLFQARSSQEKAGREIASYQNELAELRSQKNLLISESQALQHRYSVSLAEKDRHISELSQMQKEATLIPSTLYETKELERVALVRSSKPLSGEHARTEIQQYLQEIKERDLIIQQINCKAIESVQMNDTLSSQLKDSQTRYCELQAQYYTLQRDFHTVQGDIQTEVPPGAPQERANVLVEMDNFELIELRRRLVESEHQYDSLQQELSQLSERLAEERRLRGAAEDALSLAEQHIKRVEVKTPSREFSLQMESDDEREALIIDPTQHVMVRKIKGGALSLRRWLRGRSLYCSKLLTSRSKSRYIFLTYLVFLHVVVLMCLMGFS
ncbi:hypothetical protein GDO86_019774 [Hymenochirus boettgeri]|uniref:Golgin subfamily B member 1-like n=1 Tax=Hymenochirus boettgeri TaxID=247094 RepID=A0A8T2ID33_9PIPI|nr:hypothetical protein GDO86_019774 [Hymenochirus boettgeri]